MANTIDNTQDIIDIRDIIERYEELESEMPDNDNDVRNWTDSAEFDDLTNIMEDLKGYGGDEQWRGDWYPVTLIRESYFTDYIKELIHDCYEMPSDLISGAWPYRHMKMDYEAAAQEAKRDYSEIEINGVTYYYR